jgi:predicted TIM-barrel fold metal-dependent hydrolase
MNRVIDVRLRPPTGSFLKMSMFKNKDRTARMVKAMGLELSPSAEKESMDLLLEEMNSIGTYVGCVSALKRGVDPAWGWIENEEIYQIVKKFPDNLIGFGTVDASDGHQALDDLDLCVGEYGFKAIVIEPGTQRAPMYADDQRLYPVYSKCAQMGVPLFLLVGGNAGPDMSYSNPVYVERVAIDLPELKIVVLHGAWPWVTHILHVAFRRPNIYISPDMYVSFPGSDQHIQAANTFLADRLLYGTSYPFAPIVGYFEKFIKLGIRADCLDKILYENARALLNLG